jgi:hypothetical protein
MARKPSGKMSDIRIRRMQERDGTITNLTKTTAGTRGTFRWVAYCEAYCSSGKLPAPGTTANSIAYSQGSEIPNHGRCRA